MIEEQPDTEEILGQFDRLATELLRGQINRNTIRPREVKRTEVVRRLSPILHRGIR